MNLNRFNVNSNKIINTVFVILIFSLPFVSYPSIFNPTKLGQELYIVSVIALWLFFGAMAFFKIKFFKIHIHDICFLAFLSYCVWHYYTYSYFGFLYNEFWIFSGYVVLFYLFKWSLDNENKVKIFDFTAKIIWILCSVQSIIGMLQEFEFLKSENEFFKVVGTFINPNFLGVNMMIGLIAVVYLFHFQFYKNKLLKLLLFFSAISSIYVLFLTQSRASWFALFVGIVVFLGTSEKCILFIKNNKIKAFGILFGVVCLCISSLYLLYKMNTDSVDGRTLIRNITISKIVEKPFLGNGIFNFRGVYNTEKAHYFLNTNRSWEEVKVGNYVSSAFNDYLQIIFEIGISGLLLMALILFFILKDMEFDPKTRFGLALLVSFCLLAVFTTVLYNPNAMIYVIWALSILVVFGKTRIPIMEVKKQFLVKGLGLILIGISCVVGTIYYKKTIGLSSFKSVVDSPGQKIYYKLDDFDLLFIQEDPYVEFRTGLEKFEENKALGLLLMEESIKKDPMPKANIVLANLFYIDQNYIRSEKLLTTNVGLEPFRLEPLTDLMEYYIKTNQIQKKIAMAKIIINMPVKIKSKKADEYKNKAKIVLETEKK